MPKIIKISKVSSIQPKQAATRLAALVKQADPAELFSIDFELVVRGSDAANGDKSDPVFLGPVHEAVKRCFTEFGIEEMPATWGELMGGMHYCRKIYASVEFAAGGRLVDQEEAFSAVLRVAAMYNPELSESLVAYRAKDMNKMRELSRTRLTLQYMSSMFSEKQGWKSYKRKVAGGDEPAEGVAEALRQLQLAD